MAKKRPHDNDPPSDPPIKKARRDDETKEERRERRAAKKERREKKMRLREKRKDIASLPEAMVAEVQEKQQGGEEAGGEKLSKKAEKKRRKRQAEAQNGEAEGGKEVVDGGEQSAGEAEELSHKAEKRKSDTADQGETSEFPQNNQDDDPNEEDIETKPSTKHRFIVFVGNLPYTATNASVKAHFASLRPLSVRCLTDRADPTKCRGCAFVEFSSAKVMKLCLEKFHLSAFRDEKGKPRKINVELTAGGGGHKPERMEKIKRKNHALGVQRARRNQERIKVKERKKKEEEKKEEENTAGMHPSRMARMKGDWK